MRPGVAFASLVLIALGVCTASTSLGAQAADSLSRARPYSTLTVELSGVQPVSSGSLASRWQPSHGIGVDVHTPFHIGELGATIRAVRYRSRAGTEPSFQSYLLGLDLRFPLAAMQSLRPTLSITAGDFLTIYDGVQSKGAGKESEIFIGANAAVALPLRRAAQARIGLTTLQVLTSTPIRLTYVTAGVTYSLATPAWLLRMLQ